MSRTLNRDRARLRDKSKIDWLTHEQRAKQRGTIDFFRTMVTTMEEDKPLPPASINFLKDYTGSENPETWLTASWETFEKQEETYMKRLSDMAQHDLTAYHEFMRPDEPPAKHQIMMCEWLEQVERGELQFLGLSLSPGTAKSSYGSRSFVQWFMGRNPSKRVLAVGHALDVRTEIPTMKGFKTVADIAVGDEVFAADGTPTQVTAKSPVYTNHRCFEVTTSDGATVVVDENHLWTLHKRRHPISTLRLYESGPRYKPLPPVIAVQHPDSTLPIHPYLLGLWLGDGVRHGAQIVCGTQDRLETIANLADIGVVAYPIRSNAHAIYVEGLHKALRLNGLLRNKHIPPQYMTASPAQRRALVQGLMDSDGDGNVAARRLTFSNTDWQLICGMRELLWSLGIKNKLFHLDACVKIIRDAKQSHCRESWRVGFMADNVFRLKRKKPAQRAGKKSRTLHIREVDSRPTQCITVAHPSHVFLCTRAYIPTHNSQRFVEDEFSKPNRDIIDTEEYQTVFPDIQLAENDRGATMWKLQDKRGLYVCRGANAGVAGLRANMLNIDDPIKSVKDAKSQVVRDGLFRWITADLFSRRLPGCPIVLIMCLTGDTPVTLGDGSWKYMRDVIPGDVVRSYRDGKFVSRTVLNAVPQGADDVLSIRTGNTEVKANARHPFYARVCTHFAPSGRAQKWDPPRYVNAGDLKKGDKLIIANHVAKRDPARVTIDEAWLLGVVFGDGWVSTPCAGSKSIRIALGSKEADNEKISEVFARVHNYTLRRQISGRSKVLGCYRKKIVEWFEEYGIKQGGTAKTKRVPAWMFSQPVEVVRAFVDGMWFADGHVAKDNRHVMSLCNEDLVRDFQFLLRALGQRVSRVRHYHDKDVPLPQGGVIDRDRYAIAFRPNTETISLNPFIEQNIITIQSAGKQEVFDIQVADTEVFLADGCCTHNTRWHSDDPMGRLEELHLKKPDALPGPVKFINIPAECTDPETDILGRKLGDWIWPEFYPAAHFETLRSTMQPGDWSSLFMGTPLDKMGTFISESDFQRYDNFPINKKGQPASVKKTIISVDTAQKSTERSAYTAIQVFREDIKGQHFMVDAVRIQHKLDDVVKMLQKMATNWEANYILIEDAGMGSQLLENYQGKFSCPLVNFDGKNKNSKEFMFDASTPWITMGRVLFPKQAVWLTDFINELVAFPDGKYKDQVDAFSQYCQHALARRSGGTKRLIMGA
jgi:predicted phage terminase large subunit-like protein